MKMTEPEVLTEQDGVELVRLPNELTTLTHRTLENDLFLHFHDGGGWRAKPRRRRTPKAAGR
jgi:hypothetical protein